jgi:hypothetical protein
MRFRDRYAMAGLGAGIVCVLGAVALAWHGGPAPTSWTVSGLGIRSELTHAAAGTLFAIVGIALIYLTRPTTATKKTT